MILEPSLFDFKTERDVNYAIANAFVFAFNINRSKFLLDTLVWSAEQEINDDLFERAAPWNKGYIETRPGVFTSFEETPPDNPSKEESDYFSRDSSLEQYVPKSDINPAGAATEMSYKLIDNRVSILALSWWTMFISTKDGIRMIYYPYTSQFEENFLLHKYPDRSKWIKDGVISDYYRKKGVNVDKIPQFMDIDYALDFMYYDMKSLLESEGLRFVLWLYNYIKSNNFLVPYDYNRQYIKSFDDVPVYRSGQTIDLQNNSSFARTGINGELSSQRTSKIEDIQSSTGLSQTGFQRNTNSCGILINTPENIDELTFSNNKMRDRLGKITVDPFRNFVEKNSIKFDTDISPSLINSNYVLTYLNSNNISIRDIEYVTVSSKPSGQKRIFFVKKDSDYLDGIVCRLIGIDRNKTGNRIDDESLEHFNLYTRTNLRVPIHTSSLINLNIINKYDGMIDSINRNKSIIKENHDLWKTGKVDAVTEQIRRSR